MASVHLLWERTARRGRGTAAPGGLDGGHQAERTGLGPPAAAPTYTVRPPPCNDRDGAASTAFQPRQPPEATAPPLSPPPPRSCAAPPRAARPRRGGRAATRARTGRAAGTAARRAPGPPAP